MNTDNKKSKTTGNLDENDVHIVPSLSNVDIIIPSNMRLEQRDMIKLVKVKEEFETGTTIESKKTTSTLQVLCLKSHPEIEKTKTWKRDDFLRVLKLDTPIAEYMHPSWQLPTPSFISIHDKPEGKTTVLPTGRKARFFPCLVYNKKTREVQYKNKKRNNLVRAMIRDLTCCKEITFGEYLWTTENKKTKLHGFGMVTFLLCCQNYG